MSLLFKVSYGLYLLSASANEKDNACIINTFMQQTATPERVSITVNKDNLTTSLIQKSKKCVVNVLSTNCNFEIFKHFGMQSGKNVNKFENFNSVTAKNGVKTIGFFSCGYFELDVEKEIDLGTHIMFVCSISNSEILDKESEPMTYAFYHSNVKPKPQPVKTDDNQEVWVCKICGYKHVGPLPDDFICPLCKHGKIDFEKIN